MIKARVNEGTMPSLIGLSYLNDSGVYMPIVSAVAANRLAQQGYRIFKRGIEIGGFDPETGATIPVNGLDF